MLGPACVRDPERREDAEQQGMLSQRPRAGHGGVKTERRGPISGLRAGQDASHGESGNEGARFISRELSGRSMHTRRTQGRMKP